MFVNTTNDLTIFKKSEGNRPVNPLHVRRLSQSIETFGMLFNPIIVNEQYEVIDGQHRLEAARLAKSPVYYLIAPKYGLKQIQALNLNQKNWTQKDFMEAYASMGLKSYIQLKRFKDRHPYFSLTDCIALCSNITTSGNFGKAQLTKSNKFKKTKLVFNEGTWVCRNMMQAEDEASKIKMIEPYFKEGYNKTVFVGTMLYLFQNKKDVFNFSSFISKLKIRPTFLRKTVSRADCRMMVEEIYNYKRRNKVSLRY